MCIRLLYIDFHLNAEGEGNWFLCGGHKFFPILAIHLIIDDLYSWYVYCLLHCYNLTFHRRCSRFKYPTNKDQCNFFKSEVYRLVAQVD